MQVIQIDKDERYTLTKDVLIYGVSMLYDTDLDGDFTPDAPFGKTLSVYRDWFTDMLTSGSVAKVNDIMLSIDVMIESDKVRSNILSKIPLIALAMPQEGVERGTYGIFLSEPLLLKEGTIIEWKSTSFNNDILNDFRLLLYYKVAKKGDETYSRIKILESDIKEMNYSEIGSNGVITINHKFNYTNVFLMDLMIIDTMLYNRLIAPELIYGVDTKVSIARGLKGQYFLTDNEDINVRSIGNYLHVDISQTDVYYENGYSIPINSAFGYNDPLQVSFNELRPGTTVDYIVAPVIITEYMVLPEG